MYQRVFKLVCRKKTQKASTSFYACITTSSPFGKDFLNAFDFKIATKFRESGIFKSYLLKQEGKL